MSEFVECQDCEFVYRSGNSTDPVPMGSHDSCPNCGGTEFRFTE